MTAITDNLTGVRIRIVSGTVFRWPFPIGLATLSSESITLWPTEWQIDLVSAVGMVVVGALLRIMALVALLRRH